MGGVGNEQGKPAEDSRDHAHEAELAGHLGPPPEARELDRAGDGDLAELLQGIPSGLKLPGSGIRGDLGDVLERNLYAGASWLGVREIEVLEEKVEFASELPAECRLQLHFFSGGASQQFGHACGKNGLEVRTDVFRDELDPVQREDAHHLAQLLVVGPDVLPANGVVVGEDENPEQE